MSYVKVKEDENEEPIELPLDDDGTLSIASLTSAFPDSSGLKFHTESNTLRSVRFVDGKFHIHDNDTIYHTIKQVKASSSVSSHGQSSKKDEIPRRRADHVGKMKEAPVDLVSPESSPRRENEKTSVENKMTGVVPENVATADTVSKQVTPEATPTAETSESRRPSITISIPVDKVKDAITGESVAPVPKPEVVVPEPVVVVPEPVVENEPEGIEVPITEQIIAPLVEPTKEKSTAKTAVSAENEASSSSLSRNLSLSSLEEIDMEAARNTPLPEVEAPISKCLISFLSEHKAESVVITIDKEKKKCLKEIIEKFQNDRQATPYSTVSQLPSDWRFVRFPFGAGLDEMVETMGQRMERELVLQQANQQKVVFEEQLRFDNARRIAEEKAKKRRAEEIWNNAIAEARSESERLLREEEARLKAEEAKLKAAEAERKKMPPPPPPGLEKVIPLPPIDSSSKFEQIQKEVSAEKPTKGVGRVIQRVSYKIFPHPVPSMNHPLQMQQLIMTIMTM